MASLSRELLNKITGPTRQYSAKALKAVQQCPVKEEKPPVQKTFWGKEIKPKPPPECCRVKQARGERRPDPDLSCFDGQPYQTCGTAYVIQQDTIPSLSVSKTDEDKILDCIEAHPTTKHLINDPMPPYESVEQRLIDLTDRKLHPLYKRNATIPKRSIIITTTTRNKNNNFCSCYKSRSGPIEPEDIPKQLKFNSELLEKKNIFADFKRVEPPQDLIAKMIEINRNRRPTLERKKKKKNY